MKCREESRIEFAYKRKLQQEGDVGGTVAPIKAMIADANGGLAVAGRAAPRKGMFYYSVGGLELDGHGSHGTKRERAYHHLIWMGKR